MSFKDVLDLSEHLKILGYPNHVPLSALYTQYGSLESFKIVADILKWMAGRLEPGAEFPGSAISEADRILLVRSATEFFVTKAGIKVNPRKLYASASAAATELLKVTSLLINAPTDRMDGPHDTYSGYIELDLGDKIDDLRRARELSSELTNSGATLYDLLSKELINKETRNIQASRPLELANVERVVKNAIATTSQKLQSVKMQLEEGKSERNALNSKLDRKQADLDRINQRLEALQKIKPAFLEEFERLEGELKTLFEQYFIRVRCLDALRSKVEATVKSPTPVLLMLDRGGEERPADMPSMPFLPDGLVDSDDELDGDNQDMIDDIIGNPNNKLNDSSKVDERSNALMPPNAELIRSRATIAARAKQRLLTGAISSRNRLIGSMITESDSSSESLIVDASDDMDLDDGLHTDDEEEIAKLTGDAPRVRPKSTIRNDHSDEDF